MGLVEANFVCIEKKDKQMWLERGFEEQRDFPIFFGDLEEEETVMLGVPKTITAFGTALFIEAQVVEVSTRLGTYGMGGPGFFGLLCQTLQGTFWLTMTVWSSGEYVMLDGRVIECPSQYEAQYHPWQIGDDEEINVLLKDATIKGIDLSDTECRINFECRNGMQHEAVIYQYHDQLPPMGDGEPRKRAFTTGTLSDCLLVTYEDTVLLV